jgi:hypothetical protein
MRGAGTLYAVTASSLKGPRHRTDVEPTALADYAQRDETLREHSRNSLRHLGGKRLIV